MYAACVRAATLFLVYLSAVSLFTEEKQAKKKSERKKSYVLHAKHCPMCCEKQEKKREKTAYKMWFGGEPSQTEFAPVRSKWCFDNYIYINIYT